tara:strand:- start:653 stop:895 length:243 start_codon:yes stop_codon:yes gene_type:complete
MKRLYIPEPSDKVFDVFKNFIQRSLKWIGKEDNLLLLIFFMLVAWIISELSFAHFIIGLAWSYIFIVFPVFYLLKDRSTK